MNTNDFSKARAGDRVWSAFGPEVNTGQTNGVVFFTWGNDVFSVKFDNGKEFGFWRSGNFHLCDSVPSLFWSKPEIIAPPRPVRMVKKAVEVRPYYGSQKKYIHLDEKPGQCGIQEEYYCGPVQTIEILVEEE